MRTILFLFVFTKALFGFAQSSKPDSQKFFDFVEVNFPFMEKLLSAVPAFVDYDQFMLNALQSPTQDKFTQFLRITSRMATRDAGKLQQALTESENLAAQYNDFWWAYYLKFLAAIRADKKDLVQKYFFELQSKKPDSPQAWMELFRIQSALNMKNQLATTLQECVRAFPKYAPAHYELGVLYMQDGHNDQAMESFQNCINLNPQSKEAYNNIGSIYIQQSEPLKAEESFNKALAIDNRFSKAWNNRGFARYLRGSFSEALSDFNKAIEIDPEYGYAYYGRGLARIELNDKKAGCADLQKAIDLGLAGAQAALSMYCR